MNAQTLLGSLLVLTIVNTQTEENILNQLVTHVGDLSNLSTSQLDELNIFHGQIDNYGKKQIDDGKIAYENLIKSNLDEIEKIQQFAKLLLVNLKSCEDGIQEIRNLTDLIVTNAKTCVIKVRNAAKSYVTSGLNILERINGDVEKLKGEIVKCQNNKFQLNCAVTIYSYTSSKIFEIQSIKANKSKLIVHSNVEIDRCILEGYDQVVNKITKVVSCILT